MLTVKNPKATKWAEMPIDQLAYGNALDTYFTLRLFEEVLEKEMVDSGREDLITKLINPCIVVLAEIGYEGLGVDEEVNNNLDAELGKYLRDLEDQIYLDFSQVKNIYNINSGKDLIKIMYTDDDGFCMFPTEITPAGKPSTSSEVFELLGEMINEELTDRANKA